MEVTTGKLNRNTHYNCGRSYRHPPVERPGEQDRSEANTRREKPEKTCVQNLMGLHSCEKSPTHPHTIPFHKYQSCKDLNPFHVSENCRAPERTPNSIHFVVSSAVPEMKRKNLQGEDGKFKYFSKTRVASGTSSVEKSWRWFPRQTPEISMVDLPIFFRTRDTSIDFSNQTQYHHAT